MGSFFLTTTTDPPAQDSVQDSLGNLYEVFIYGAPRLDGTWEGWLEFVSLSHALPSLRTERETTQPDRAALEYWATGLEPMFLAGAWRARSRVNRFL